MFVKCIKGYPGILEEEQIYEVETVTPSGHFVLREVSPPSPFTCFNKERFVPFDIDDISIEGLFEIKMEI